MTTYLSLTEESSLESKDIRRVTVPLGVEQMKEFFTNKNLLYFVDYSKSSLKGVVFLTYLSNLDLPFEVDLENSTFEEKEGLLVSYMTARNITKSKVMSFNLASLLLKNRGVDINQVFDDLIFTDEESSQFIENNKELITKWNTFLESTILFSITSMEELDKKLEIEENYEVVNDPQYLGLNVVNLFSIPSFMELFFSAPSKGELKFFKPQFEETMFRGKNLYAYFNVDENSVFHAFGGLVNGKLGAEEFMALKKLETPS